MIVCSGKKCISWISLYLMEVKSSLKFWLIPILMAFSLNRFYSSISILCSVMIIEETKKQWQHQLQQKKCTFHPHEKKIFGISSSQHSSASSLSSPDVLSVVFLTSHILKKKWYKNKDGRCEWMHRHKSFMSWSIHKKIKKEGRSIYRAL